MKNKLKLWAVACCLSLMQSGIFAQETTINCNDQQEEISLLLENGLIPEEKQYEVFTMASTCAEGDNALAAYNLGVLYKDGIGCALNFDKAKFWFEKAVTLGNQKAAYALGYLYLKGLGSIEQDYEKALYWFAKSDYEMARHWTAYCIFFGYGTPQNKMKAIKLLQETPTRNSQTLLQQFLSELQWNSTKKVVDSTKVVVEEALTTSQKTEKESTTNLRSPFEQIFYEGFVGKLVTMDWSGKHKISETPASIKLDPTQPENNFILTIGTQSVAANPIMEDGTFIFENTIVSLPFLYPDHPEHKVLHYDLQSIRLTTEEVNGNSYEIGVIEAQIVEWAEPAPPMYFIFSTPQSDLDDAILAALEAQKDSFIKLYPNPFVSDLLIQYELEKPSKVTVEFYNYTGTNHQQFLELKDQNTGKHTMTLDKLDVPNGLYVVRIIVDGTEHTKMVVKK